MSETTKTTELIDVNENKIPSYIKESYKTHT